MGTPTNTYDSTVNLNIGQVPIDIEDRDPAIYQELLDIHNALERIVASFTDDTSGIIEYNDLTENVVWADIPDANVPESAITQHEGAITLTEAQIVAAGAIIDGASVITAGSYFQYRTETAANIADATHVVNTDPGKRDGAAIWDTTNNKIKVATGNADTSTWVDADGTNAVTPS